MQHHEYKTETKNLADVISRRHISYSLINYLSCLFVSLLCIINKPKVLENSLVFRLIYLHVLSEFSKVLNNANDFVICITDYSHL